jgi:hypothetical protein
MLSDQLEQSKLERSSERYEFGEFRLDPADEIDEGLKRLF